MPRLLYGHAGPSFPGSELFQGKDAQGKYPGVVLGQMYSSSAWCLFLPGQVVSENMCEN